MTTLTAAPLAPLLDRLFTEADAAEADTNRAFAHIPSQEQARLMQSKTGYRDLYGRVGELNAIAIEELQLLPGVLDELS